jgi:hypothetical protein
MIPKLQECTQPIILVSIGVERVIVAKTTIIGPIPHSHYLWISLAGIFIFVGKKFGWGLTSESSRQSFYKFAERG